MELTAGKRGDTHTVIFTVPLWVLAKLHPVLVADIAKEYPA